MTVTSCTYQSIGLVEQAQLSLDGDSAAPAFDLVLCDEAHRTTGVEGPGDDTSPFVLVHDAARTRAAKRLYMTATPRLYTEGAKRKAANHAVEVFSMDDEGIYGPEFHRLPFSRAVEQDPLSDYKVVSRRRRGGAGRRAAGAPGGRVRRGQPGRRGEDRGLLAGAAESREPDGRGRRRPGRRRGASVARLLPFPPVQLPPGAIYAKIVEKCGDRKYWEQWAGDVADIYARLVLRIEGLLAARSSETLRRWVDLFVEELKVSMHEQISRSDAVEMLAQHPKPVNVRPHHSTVRPLCRLRWQRAKAGADIVAGTRSHRFRGSGPSQRQQQQACCHYKDSNGSQGLNSPQCWSSSMAGLNRKPEHQTQR